MLLREAAVSRITDLLPLAPTETLTRPLLAEHAVIVCLTSSGRPIIHRATSPSIYGGFLNRLVEMRGRFRRRPVDKQSCLLIVGEFSHDRLDDFAGLAPAIKEILASFGSEVVHVVRDPQGGFSLSGHTINHPKIVDEIQSIIQEYDIPEASLPSASPEPSDLEKLEDVERRLHQALLPFRDELQAVLKGMEGKAYGSFNNNQAVASKLNVLLRTLSVRLKCPRTGLPATIRCIDAPRTKQGSFELRAQVKDEHKTIQKTTFSSVSLPPKLTLVDPHSTGD